MKLYTLVIFMVAFVIFTYTATAGMNIQSLVLNTQNNKGFQELRLVDNSFKKL